MKLNEKIQDSNVKLIKRDDFPESWLSQTHSHHQYIPLWSAAMGRGGLTPQTTPNLLDSDDSPNQIQPSENTEVVGRQSISLLRIEGD